MHDVALTDRGSHPLGHPHAEVGEVVAVAAPVEHALGVVDLAVAEQVHGGVGGHGVSWWVESWVED